MRAAFYCAATLALAMLYSPEALRSALATSASALFEATPFLVFGAAVARLLRAPHAAAYLGCGCAAGPSARSLPATAATWLVFGPLIAATRLGAAIAVARLLHKSRPSCSQAPDPLGELRVLLPAALLAGAAIQVRAIVDPGALGPVAGAAAGAALGFFAAPCGLGAIAVAGALRIASPPAAAAFLCVAGIFDLRALRRRKHNDGEPDAFAYVLLATALAIVAARRGDALVHPIMALPLAICAAASLLAAFAYRHRQSATQRYAPALMLVGALIAAPPPLYHATETTLTDLFPGEHLTFTGALTRSRNTTALVRYAITCCRADAVPVAVRLAHAPPYAPQTWLRIDGTVENPNGELLLAPQRIEKIPAPTDPFIYR